MTYTTTVLVAALGDLLPLLASMGATVAAIITGYFARRRRTILRIENQLAKLEIRTVAQADAERDIRRTLVDQLLTGERDEDAVLHALETLKISGSATPPAEDHQGIANTNGEGPEGVVQ